MILYGQFIKERNEKNVNNHKRNSRHDLCNI